MTDEALASALRAAIAAEEQSRDAASEPFNRRIAAYMAALDAALTAELQEEDRAAPARQWNTRPERTITDLIDGALPGLPDSFTAKDVLAAIQAAGWQSAGKTPLETVRTTLRKFTERGTLVACGRGRYCKPDVDAPSEDAMAV
jgi:hypothetical protein